MEPVKGYEGVIRGDVVLLNEKVGLPEGTPVLVFPQSDPEEWLTRSHVAQLFAVSPGRLDGWVRSGKVRENPADPRLVSVSDVEDAAEQDDLLAVTLLGAADEEDE